ncbi:DUF1223 domain-containing protein [Rhodobacteraceae bacterium NNCM2]|nr:DUF1223 domain-containing protein [Coraliihabitans acroporae]
MKKVTFKHGAAILATAAATLTAAPAAWASPAVFVELFTSQGCYSCPPADEVLGKLADRDDIVALSLHVDYWDYLGWRDTFAQKAFTERQFAYRDAMDERVVYTPQMIVQGVSPVTGSNGMTVKEAIEKVRALPDVATVRIVEMDGALKGKIAPINGGAKATLYIAKYTRDQVVDIERGENAGKQLPYHNVVNMLSKVQEWSGETMDEVDLPQPGPGEGIALWLQSGEAGEVLAAAKYER